VNNRTLIWATFAAVTTAAGFFLCMIPFFGPVFLFWVFGGVYARSPVAQAGSKTAWLILISLVVTAFSLLWDPSIIYGWVVFSVYIALCCVVGAIAFIIASYVRKPKPTEG